MVGRSPLLFQEIEIQLDEALLRIQFPTVPKLTAIARHFAVKRGYGCETFRFK